MGPHLPSPLRRGPASPRAPRSRSSAKGLGVRERGRAGVRRGSFLGTLLGSAAALWATMGSPFLSGLSLPVGTRRVLRAQAGSWGRPAEAGPGGSGPPTAAAGPRGPRGGARGSSPGGGRGAGSWRPRSCSLSTCRGQTARARPALRAPRLQRGAGGGAQPSPSRAAALASPASVPAAGRGRPGREREPGPRPRGRRLLCR